MGVLTTNLHRQTQYPSLNLATHLFTFHKQASDHGNLLHFCFYFSEMIGNPLFDLENNLPDELFSTSGGAWGATTASVGQPSQQQQQPQPQCVQRPQSLGPPNQGMGMSMGMGQGNQQQNGSMDAQHHHQMPPHMMQNKTSINSMSGGAISAGGSAIGPNNMNLAKGPHNSKLNSPPGGAPMMMNAMGNGPQMMQNMQQQQQQQQTMNNMLNPNNMSVNMGHNSGGNVPMKTPVSMMGNTGQMSGQNLHNGPQAMMGNARPVGVMPNNMMQQQQPLRGQLIQGMNSQGPRLQVS